MSGFDADAAALWAAGHQLRTLADELGGGGAVARSQVNRLLDGGWTGAAAAAYEVAWREWDAGFARAVAALHEMAGLLDDTGGEYNRAEATTRAVVLGALS